MFSQVFRLHAIYWYIWLIYNTTFWEGCFKGGVFGNLSANKRVDEFLTLPVFFCDIISVRLSRFPGKGTLPKTCIVYPP